MKVRKVLNIAVSLLVLSGLLFGNTPGTARAENAAMPMDPRDETKVPHYFGPNPNWALSPLRLANVAVTLTRGGGIGAAASANVGMQTGAITGFTILNPGSGYTSVPTVEFAPIYDLTTGSGASATAVALMASSTWSQ